MKTNFLTKFWTIQNDAITVTLSDVIEFLKCNNFGTYYGQNDVHNTEPVTIRIDNNIASKFNKPDVVNYCLNCINNSDESDLNKMKILGELIEKTKHLSTSDLLILPKINPEFVKDSKYKAYIFFKNKFVVVSSNYENPSQAYSYDKLPGVVWDHQVIEKDIYLLKDFKDPYGQNFSFAKSEYDLFFENLVKDVNSSGDTNNSDVLRATLGYLLHNYYDPTIPRAVLFTDVDLNMNSQVGVGIPFLLKTLMFMKKSSVFSSNGFIELSDYKYSKMDKDSELLVFESIKENFEFNEVNSLLKSGIEVENKFEKGGFIRTDNNYKIIFTSNNNLLKIIPKYIGKIAIGFDFSYSSIKETLGNNKYNHLVYESWTDSEWNHFFNFMISCVSQYIRYGFPIYDKGYGSLYTDDSIVSNDPF